MTDREIEALEQETENTRTRVSGLLDELRGRISPGEMVDQMVGYAGDGAGEVVRTLGNQLRNNPLPALLVGVGVAWLMLSDSRSRPRSAPDNRDVTLRETRRKATEAAFSASKRSGALAASAADRLGTAYEGASDAATRAVDTVTEFGQQGVDAAYELGSRATENAAALGQQAMDRATELGRRASSSTSAMGQRATEAVSEAGQAASDLGKRALTTANQILQEQPLVAAGIGLAIGAALGALLPATEGENRLMGAASDEIKDRARQAAVDQYGELKDTAQDIYGTVVDTVAREVSRTEESDMPADTLQEPASEHGPRSAG